MCKENGLSVAGRKAELVARLEDLFSEESISLEEVETVPLPAVEDAETVPLPAAKDTEEVEEEILVAEFVEAEIIEENTVEKLLSGKSTTLKEQIMNPKVAAVLLAIVIAGGGWYWYVSNQLQPFTADDLRYGDSMEYTILNGEIDATGEYVDFVKDNIESESLENACRLQLEFDGEGTTSVTNGGTAEKPFNSSGKSSGSAATGGMVMVFFASNVPSSFLHHVNIAPSKFEVSTTTPQNPYSFAGSCAGRISNAI